MNDIEGLLKRQAQWQKKQQLLSWEEKIHRAEAVREQILKLRHSRPRTKPDQGSQG